MLEERVEERVKETLERVAETGPSEAGGYDRFLRRRRRAARNLTAAAGVVLVVLLGLAVAVPQLLPARRTATQSTTPAAGGGAAALSRPHQGFEVDMPDGWSFPKLAGGGRPPVQPADDGRILLQQVSPRVAEMTISTGLIDPRYNAALGRPYGGPSPPTGIQYLKPGGTVSSGRRPDGRPFLRTVQHHQDGSGVANYYLWWPYRCALGPDLRCPAVLGLRVLHVQLLWTKLAQPAKTIAVAERVVQTARPIGNAVEAAPVPGQPGCDAKDPDRLGVVETYRGRELRDPKTGAYALAPGTVVARLRLADYNLVYCRLQHKIAVVVMDGDTPAAVRGNGLAAPVSGALLGMVASHPLGSWANWEWTNWCGSRSATAWYVDPRVRPAKRLARIASSPPPCLDRSYPSVLQGGHVMP
jgi:hypothetical protein